MTAISSQACLLPGPCGKRISAADLFEPNRRRSAPARVAVHGLNASTAMLDDDKQAPSVAAWKNEQVVLAPFVGDQGSRPASAAGSATDIERFWRVDHRHGRMLTLARGSSCPFSLGLSQVVRRKLLPRNCPTEALGRSPSGSGVLRPRPNGISRNWLLISSRCHAVEI